VEDPLLLLLLQQCRVLSLRHPHMPCLNIFLMDTDKTTLQRSQAARKFFLLLRPRITMNKDTKRLGFRLRPIDWKSHIMVLEIVGNAWWTPIAWYSCLWCLYGTFRVGQFKEFGINERSGNQLKLAHRTESERTRIRFRSSSQERFSNKSNVYESK
jgi:hypothetical protein